MPSKPDIPTLRQQLGGLDTRLLQLLSERMLLSRQIGLCKRQQGLPVVQPAAAEQRWQALQEEGRRLGLNPQFLQAYWQVLHQESCRQQEI